MVLVVGIVFSLLEAWHCVCHLVSSNGTKEFCALFGQAANLSVPFLAGGGNGDPRSSEVCSLAVHRKYHTTQRSWSSRES
eukprot:6358419-Amphidinium_carterae.1